MAFRMLIWREAAGGISSASSLLLWWFCSNPNVIHNLCFPSWPLSLWAGNWLCCIELLQLGVKGRDALACVERCSMEILMIEQCQIEVVPLRDLIALTFIGDPSVWLLFGLWEWFLGLTPAFYTKLIFPYELVSLSIRKFTLWRTKITWTIFRTISESKSCGSDHRADRKSCFIYLFLVNLGAVFKFKLGCDRKNSGLLRSKSQEGYVSVFCTARCASMSFLKNIYMVFV